MNVDATDPSETDAGTRLLVRVLGSGFDDGSQATFQQGPGGNTLITHSTTFVSGSELVTDLEAPADAEVGLYDVEVLTARGRKGIGIELFKVKDPSIKATLTFSFQDAANNITSDGRGSYVDGECGVSAHLRVNPSNPDDTDGNARLISKTSKLTPAEAETCTDKQRDPREIRVSFSQRMEGSPPGSADGQVVGAYFMNIADVELVPIGSTVERPVVMYFSGDECYNGLRFNPENDSNTHLVLVTKNTDGSWTIETQQSPKDVAVCLPNESRKNSAPSYYHMPFHVTVRVK